VLEFDAIRRLIGQCMSSALGQALLSTVLPLGDLSQIRQKQRETSEARLLLLEGPSISLQQLTDPRPWLDQIAQQGKVLEPRELLDLHFLLLTARQVKRTLTHAADRYPLLAALAEPMQFLHPVEEAIVRTVDARGEVKDSASPLLQSIRGELRGTRDRIRHLLERHLAQDKDAVQEPLITLRNNRYVIPLKVEHRRVLAGIVHDHSASRATVFVEPLDVLELNNRVVELRAAEAVEVHRILRQVTTAVWEVRAQIRHIADTLGEIDYCLARGRLSQQLRCHEPVFSEDGRIELRQARHPLLVEAARSSPGGPPVVPCGLVLDADTRTLVITGPNTGGKTVLLKTVGLLTLMGQAGLHIPAEEGSQLALFQQVAVDIGDEQSIEQSLSTFSGHMRHIIACLREVDDRSLVLLDELGAGTDPAEGAALGTAILEHLYRRGAKTLVTTHQNQLKVYAYQRPGMETAAMEFDAATLQPTFRLRLGHFGGSNALAISQRLGMPDEVLATARAQMDPGAQRLAEVADRLQAELRTLESLRQEADQERRSAAQARQTYEARLAGIEEERRLRLAQTTEAGRQLLAEARQRLDEAIRQVREQGQPAAAAREGLREVAEQLETLTAEAHPRRSEPAPVCAGDPVWLPMWGIRGVVLTQPSEGDLVEVQAGRMTLKVPPSQLAPATDPQPSRQQRRRPLGAVRADVAQDIPPEINLIGRRVEEALQQLDKYLDTAVVAGLPRVRIIHGKGTGRLRAAVHEHLTSHPQVKAFVPCSPADGGWGATLVEMDT
jgi:DNA mismatch repair protein MutS2